MEQRLTNPDRFNPGGGKLNYRERTMDIFEYETLLNTHDFRYRKVTNAREWQKFQRHHEKMIQLSYTSPVHRELFLRYYEKSLTK
jgi:hypothetical protein